MTLKVTAS